MLQRFATNVTARQYNVLTIEFERPSYQEENTMRRKITAVTLITMLIAAMAGLVNAGSAAPLSTPELRKTIQSGKKTVIFFINPEGGPCRAQKELLVKLHKDRKGNFNIAYVSTMNPADQKAFYDYGIRSLPTLVVVDSKGQIGRFFPPGIQSPETLAAALDGVK